MTAALVRAGLAGGIALLAVPDVRPQSDAEAPCSDAVATLAARLDDAFERGDASAYLAPFAPFEPLHAALYHALAKRIRMVLQKDANLERRSSVRRHWRLGPHAVAWVVSETRNADHPALGPVEEHVLWAVRGPDADPAIVLAVDVDPETLEAMPDAGDPLRPKHRLRCLACNYTIRAGDDWLMVPNCKARTGCLESFSFYSLRFDLSVDLTIHLDPGEEVPTPAAMLRGLVEHVVGIAADRAPVRDWIPPMYTPANRPKHLHGARCVLADAGDGTPAEAYLATYGRIGYLMVVRGRAAVVESHRDAIDGLMASFALDDPTLDPEQVERRITEGRQGGRLDGHVYTNERHGVRFVGPKGWPARLAASYYAFDVRWRRPAPDREAFVRVKAMKPMGGTTVWTVPAVERTLRNACEGSGLEVLDDTDWAAGPAGFERQRTLTSSTPGAAADDRVLLRVVFAPDLLVVVEVRAPEDEMADLRRAADGLERIR